MNRATAAAMGLPTYRKFQRRQDEVGGMLRAILDRVLDEATRAGKLGANTDRTYRILFPELAPGDNATAATAVAGMLPALLQAHGAGWMSRGTGMRLLYEMAGQDVNVEQEIERIAAEQAQMALHPQAARSPGTPASLPGPAR